ncbi:Protein of unknown function [Lachnospiraceae bacterium]|nr:Protein of unknown function [Lachnospiraceae bacterium]
MDTKEFNLRAEEMKMSGILKGFIVCTAILGLVLFLVGLPEIGKSILRVGPEFAYCYYPWLIFLWLCAVPFYIILAFAWMIADNIGREKAFSYENEKLFNKIFKTTAAGVIFFFAGNVLFLLLNMSHPGVLILSIIIIFIGSAFAFCARVLEKMCSIAAELKEQNELTI